eukprot:14438936-Alexandrium_andersonii.AAC.1
MCFFAKTSGTPIVPSGRSPGLAEVVLACSLVVRERDHKVSTHPRHAVVGAPCPSIASGSSSRQGGPNGPGKRACSLLQGQRRGQATQLLQHARGRPGCCLSGGPGGRPGPCSGQAWSDAAASGLPTSGFYP